MKVRGSFTRMMSGGTLALALAWTADRPAEATPPSGVTFTIISRATVPAFDALRRYREVVKDAEPRGHVVWRIALEATREIEIWTVLFTVQPGGHGGWHTHPGPALFTVGKGTLTLYDGDDPSCRPHLFPAGTGSVEADTSGHVHITRNETDSPVETVVTFLVPLGAGIRTDLPDPGNCPF